MTERFDLLITGGTVLDPGAGLRGVMDVGVRSGRVAAIAPALPRDAAAETIDAAGCYVSPGFVDMHAHVYWGVNYFAIDADPYCTATGVTTVVDCGSAGSINFPGLRRYVVEQSRTRILALVHVGQYGIQPMPTGELRDILYADPEGAVEQATANADIVVGIKIRMGTQMVGENGPKVLDMGFQAAEAARTRLMVHIGDTPMPVEEIADRLRPGDILTHCFTGLPQPIVDEKGRVRPAVRRAYERGVIFDVAHARRFMMDFRVARAAMEQGVLPHTLSTDAFVTRRPGSFRDPGFDLPMVLTKFLAMGWSLEQVVEACTVNPARVLGWSDRIGRLETGREADITVFELREGPVTLWDTEGNTIPGECTVEPVWTIRAGQARAARGHPEFAGGDGGN